MEDGGERRAGVLDVDIDVAGHQRAIADERASEIQPALDRQPGVALDGFGDDLAKNHLLGEIFRADDNGAARPAGHQAARQEDGRHRCRRERDRRAPRASPPPRRELALHPQQPAIDRQGKERCGDRSREDDRRVDHRQSAIDVLAESAGANRSGDGGRADADDSRDADARGDRRQGERQFDQPEQLVRRHAHRDAGLANRCVDPGDSGDRRPNNREQSVQDQHDHGGARPDAAQERHR